MHPKIALGSRCVLCVLCVALCSCTDLGVDDVLYPCTSDGSCGEGFSCVEGVCRAEGAMPSDDISTSGADASTSPQDGADPDTYTPPHCGCSVGQVSIQGPNEDCACVSIQEVVLGGQHTCARLRGLNDAQQTYQSVYCWGDNTLNQTNPHATSTAPIVRPTHIDIGEGEPVALCAGQSHTCALIDVGSGARVLRCWGDSSRGQLGTASDSEQVGDLNVYEVPGLGSDIRLITCGAAHTCALVGETQVLCWGDNANGQLGTQTQGIIKTPSRVEGVLFDVGGVRALASKRDHSCALYNSGLDIGCWGLNTHGQLGRADSNTSEAPQNVTLDADSDGLPSHISQVSVGLAHTCLRGGTALEQGSVYCWGSNALNQLGVGAGTASLASPLSPANLSPGRPIQGAISLGVGDLFSCAVIEYGGEFQRELYCWGDNTSGQLSATPGTLEYATAMGDGSVTEFAYVAAGGQHACALQDTLKALYCWGNNTRGQIGIGTLGLHVGLTPVLMP